MTTQQRANTVPPRLQHTQQQQVQQPKPSLQDASANRPKRYSSLRQRPTITEGPGQQNFPSPHGQHTFYPSQGNVYFINNIFSKSKKFFSTVCVVSKKILDV